MDKHGEGDGVRLGEALDVPVALRLGAPGVREEVPDFVGVPKEERLRVNFREVDEEGEGEGEPETLKVGDSFPEREAVCAGDKLGVGVSV